jgi:hypothetical protein
VLYGLGEPHGHRGLTLFADPNRCCIEPLSEQVNVEQLCAVVGLFLIDQIKQHSRTNTSTAYRHGTKQPQKQKANLTPGFSLVTRFRE